MYIEANSEIFRYSCNLKSLAAFSVKDQLLIQIEGWRDLI